MKIEILDKPVFTSLKINLEKGEKVKAESGAMVTMSPTIDLKAKTQGKGIGGMVKAAIGGENIFISEYTANENASEVLFAPSSPGDILEFNIKEETIFCKGGSFLVGMQDLEISTKGSLKGLFSGTGLFLQKISGNGKFFINSYGSIIEKTLSEGEELKIDTGHLLAFDSNITYKVKLASKGFFSSILSGEGLICTVKGPGKVWIQTRNIQSLAQNIAAYLPKSNQN